MDLLQMEDSSRKTTTKMKTTTTTCRSTVETPPLLLPWKPFDERGELPVRKKNTRRIN
jgi:hypothetical protein